MTDEEVKEGILKSEYGGLWLGPNPRIRIPSFTSSSVIEVNQGVRC